MKDQLVIFNLVPEEIKYHVTSEDMSRFQGVYINSGEEPDLEEELMTILYDEEGNYSLEFTDIEDIDLSNIDRLVEVGFIL